MPTCCFYCMHIKAPFAVIFGGFQPAWPIRPPPYSVVFFTIALKEESRTAPPFSVSLTDSLPVTTNLDKWKTGVSYDIWVTAQWPAWGKSTRCFASQLKKVKPPGEDGCVSAAGFRKQSSLVVRADVWWEVGGVRPPLAARGLINGRTFAVMQSKLTAPFNNIYFLSACWLQPGPCLKLKCVISAPLASQSRIAKELMSSKRIPEHATQWDWIT